MENFKQFDAVTDASDHHYVRPGQQLNKQVTKKIMQEWKILKENLPESSIFVRVYEDRMDLLRAVILGPPGTPYHNGLFFFDICFPTDYPAKAPKVNYRSFGYRLNPNLYNRGKVCLSLLNTWSGKKNEKWNSCQSTLLQVLLSIQGLILNEMPYYNEPVYANMKGDANAYNEHVWVDNCSTMMHLLHKPPKHFEQFVKEHFRDKADAILTACRAYVSGTTKVGGLVQDGTSCSSVYKVSTKFMSSMIMHWPRLLDNFAYCGAASSVEKFRAEPMLLPTKSRDGTAKKPMLLPTKSRDGTAMKTLHKLLEIFGCLKMNKRKKKKESPFPRGRQVP